MVTKKKRKGGVGTGASIARVMVQRKITRLKKAYDVGSGAQIALDELRDWLKGMPKRTAKEGGIGKR